VWHRANVLPCLPILPSQYLPFCSGFPQSPRIQPCPLASQACFFDASLETSLPPPLPSLPIIPSYTSPSGLIKHALLGSILRALIPQVWGGAQECAHLTSSQGLLPPLAQGLPLENT
jgi:hypothetical protein